MKIDIGSIKQFENLELLAKQMVEGFITGLYKSPYHGFSVEFAEHRLYNTGESTRHIDWKVFAKTDRLYTKRYEEETNLRCHLVIDNSSSMYYPKSDNNKIKFTIFTAAALIYLLQKQRDAVGLFTFSDRLEQQTQVKSTPSHAHKLLLLLEELIRQDPLQRKTDVSKILHQVADKIHKRSLIIIFSDMFQDEEKIEEIFSALQHLKHNKHEVLLFHVTDRKTELEFQFEDRPYEFIDMESGERMKLKPPEIRDIYTTKMEEYYQKLKLKCGQFKIDFVEADIEESYHKVLGTYLIKRSRMQ